MTHPIETAMTEAVTMAKLMRENEELRRQIAEERALCDRLARAISDDLDSWPLYMLDGSVVAMLVRQWRNKRGEVGWRLATTMRCRIGPIWDAPSATHTPALPS